MASLTKYFSIKVLILSFISCTSPEREPVIQTVTGKIDPQPGEIWLTHEHILVDFIGADSIDTKKWNHDSVIRMMTPYLEELKQHEVKYFVETTPAYLGRDVALLKKIAEKTGLHIITNTGFYGAQKNKFVPAFAFDKTPEELAEIWTKEFENGIDVSGIKPGLMKISVDAADTLHPMHEKLVKAAALTHLKTGLTIASHTGEAKGLWPQLKILKETSVSPIAFIWVHAQNENDNNNYVRAAREGCWISLDGLGWELDKHVEKLVFAKEKGILNKILISHDAGWYDPQKQTQSIQPYTNIFAKLIPALQLKGFTKEDINLLLSGNPAKAFAIQIRKL
jgi:phosphotriesterase-related protein